MQTLPVTPVETLATALRTAAPRNENPGIVPPWLAAPRPANPGKNPGIVPPWLLQPQPVQPDEPVADDVPRILGSANPTGFDREPVLA
jgi:hypothetical protein